MKKKNTSPSELVQEKLIKFATRNPAFMYLIDFRENTLQDVITKLELDLFHAVTGLTVKDFQLLVRLKVFNTEQMNQAVFAFRRYEDTSLHYTGIESHEGLTLWAIRHRGGKKLKGWLPFSENCQCLLRPAEFRPDDILTWSSQTWTLRTLEIF